LCRKAAWCRGRGEQLTPIHVKGTLPLLLICPLVGLSTAAVYRELQAPAWRENESRRDGQNGGSYPLTGDRGLLQQALEQGDFRGIGSALFNRLQTPAERLLPLVAEIRQLLDELASENLIWGHQMSGSGSSYFVVCRGQAEAQRLARLVSIRWAGGVLNTGMGTAEPKDGPPERTIRLFVTQATP
jgi:4-diphosphocytidyl-2-C-methyl-D-erythritol kinase